MIIQELKDLPSGDGSVQYSMQSEAGQVDFAIFQGELCAHTWSCPGEGRIFLKELEKQAAEKGLKLTIPTVLSPKLEKILKDNGYTMKEVPYMGDVIELWSKD